jgi:hypothetical protein
MQYVTLITILDGTHSFCVNSVCNYAILLDIANVLQSNVTD